MLDAKTSGRLMAVTCLTLVPGACRAQASATSDCFASGSIVGAVLGTFFATAITVGLIAYLLWCIYKRRAHDGSGTKGARAVAESGFDNPCFDSPNPDAVDGEEAKRRGQEAKTTSWTPLRFFGPNKTGKKRALDDSFVSEPEHVSVQLRGHDFTGLGFNVTGNMRDGIFVKDILNRGPAFECGRIAQGDRILGVTISFRHIVYEDALTILSYASPYDVTLELEKGQNKTGTLVKQRKAASTGSLMAAGASAASASSSVAVSGQLPEGPVIHPLYRSQSIDDLSKVGRDASVRADVRIPNLSGGLIKSKLLGKAHVETEVPDVKIKVAKPGAVIDAGDISVALPHASAKASGKFTKFGIKVLPDLKMTGGVKADGVSVTDLPVGLGAPDVDLPKVQVHMPKPADIALTIDVPDSAPSVSLPKADASIVIDAPEVKLPEVKLPEVDLEVSAPKIKVDVPDVTVSADVPGVELGKDAKSGFNLKFPKFGQSIKTDDAAALVSVGAASADVSLPEASLEVDAKLKKESIKRGFKMPKLSMKKKGDASLDVKGAAPSVSVEMPEVNVDVKTPKASVELPGVEVPSASVEAKTSKMGFSLPKFHLGGKGHGDVKEGGVELGVELSVEAPSVKVDLPRGEVDVEGVELPSVDVKAPEVSVDVKAPEIEVDVPSISVEGKKGKMGFSMPKFGLGGKSHGDVEVNLPATKVELPKVDVDVGEHEKGEGKKKSKFGFSLKMPKIGGNVNVPDVELEAPKVDVELPKVEMAVPKIEIEAPAVNAEVNVGAVPKLDVNLPSVEVFAKPVELDAAKEIDIKLPKVDVTLPSVDISAEVDNNDDDGKKKSGKFGIKMPKFGFSGPDVEVSASKDVDITLPKASVEMPALDVDLKTEASDDEGEGKKKGKFGFGIKMPKFGASAPGIDVNLPKVDVDLPKIDVELPKVDVELPKVDVELPKVDVELPKIDVEVPKIDAELPKVDVELPKIDVDIPKVDVELPSVDIEAPRVDIEVPKVDIELPKVDVELPKVDIELPKAGVEMPKVDLKMPSFDISADLSDSELDGDGKKKKFGIGFKMPKFGVSAPEAEVDIDVPKLDVTGSSDGGDHDAEGGKKKSGFSIKMPKFGFNKPEIDVNLPDVKLEGPSVNVALPEVKPIEGKIDVELPKASVELPTLPSVTAELPDVSVEVPSVEIGVPSVDITAPDIVLPSVEGKKPKVGFSLPKFHIGGKGDSKDVDLRLGAPEVKVDVPEVKGELPGVDVSVDLPNVSVPEVELPSVSVEGKKSKMGFHLPKFHLGGKGHAEAKEAELSVEAPSVEVKLPQASVHFSDDEDDSSKKKKSIKLPKFGLGGKGDVDVSLPSLDVELPKVEIDDAEKGEVEGGTKKKKGGFHIKMPKFGTPKAEVDVNLPDVNVQAPTVSVDLPGIKTSGAEIDMTLPKADLTVKPVNVELPEVSVEVDPKLKKESAKGGFDFKMPKLSMKKKADASVDVKGPTIELPDVKIDAKLPEASIDVDAPSVDLPSVEGKKSKIGFSMPKFHLGGKGHGEHKEAGIDVNMDAPSVKLALPEIKGNLPSVSVELPEVELKAPEISAEIGAPSVDVEIPSIEASKKTKIGLHMPSLPKFGFGGKGDVKDVELSVEAPGVKVDLPDVKTSIDFPDSGVELTGPEVAVDVHPGDISLPEIDVPSVSVEGKKPKVGFQLPKLGLGGKGEVEVTLPDVEVPSKVEVESGEHEKGDGKKKSKFGIGFKMPKIGASVTGPEAELSVEAPKLDVSLPKVDVELPKVDVKVEADDEDEDEAEGGAKKKKGFHIKMPKFGAPKAELDVNLPSVKLEGPSVAVDVPEVKAPEASLEVVAPKVSVDEGSKKRYKFGFGGPKVQAAVPDVSVPSVELEMPKGKIEIPDVQLEAGVEGDHDDDDDKKKRSKFSIKMPKFHMKKKAPGVDVDLEKDASLSVNVEGGLEAAGDDEPGNDDNHDKNKRGKISVKMPKFGMKKPHLEVDLPDVEKDVTVKLDAPSLEVNAPEVSIDLPDVKFSRPEVDVSVAEAPAIVADIEIEKPKLDVGIEVPSVGVSASGPSVSMELPKADIELDVADADDDEKKKSNKFSFKLPKFNIGGKHHGEVKAEVPAGVKLDLPEVELQPASLELDASLGVDVHDDESDEKDGTKKKSRFGIKLPKFQMNKPHLDAGKIDEASVSVKLPSLTTDEIEVEDMDVFLPKAEVDMPTGKVNIDASSVDVELPDAKKKGAKFSFKKSNFKMPKISMSGKGNVDIEAPDVSLPKVEFQAPSIEAPKLDVSLPKLELDVKTEAKDDEDDDDDEFTINIPKMDIDLAEVKPNVTLSTGSIELPSVEAKLEVEPTKKSPFIDKMPELDPIAAGIDLTLAKAKIDFESDASDDDGDDGNEAKSYKLGIKMPKFSFGAKGVNVEAEAPGVDVAGNMSIDTAAPSVSLDTSDLEADSLKISAKVPKVRQRVPDVVLPQVELKADVLASDDEGKEIKIESKKPKFGIKLPTVEFGKPKAETDAGIAINLPRVDVQPTYAAESMSFELEMPQVELDAPSVELDVGNIDAQMESLDAEVERTKAQLYQLQAEMDLQAGKKTGHEHDASDDDDERKTKSHGFHLGLRMPKFHLGKEKQQHEVKADVELPSVSVKSVNPDEPASMSLSSLETEPVKLESTVAVEKEKKKFSLKMPKFQSKTSITTEATVEDVDAEPKSYKVNVKAPKVKSRKKNKGEQPQSGDESNDEHEDDEHQKGTKDVAGNALMDVEVKLPRVQVYKNVEYHDSERAHESSTDDEDESKDIKKNIGARFGVKLKKPKMFSSNKVEISSSKSEPGPSSATLQPEWKLPRVDLRRSSKSTDQELSVNVDMEIDQQRLEQLSPSERAEAIRRDAKASAGIRLHSPSYISKMHSPRSKKSSLEMMDTDSSPRLLSVTRLDSVPGNLSSAFTGTTTTVSAPVEVTVNAPQISPSQVPSTLLAASDAVKLKRGPPTPVKRSVTDPFRVAIPINASIETAVEDIPAVTAEVTVTSGMEPKGTVYLSGQPQASDTDISVTTSVDSDTLGAIPLSTSGSQETPSRKASSLGDLTRIPPSAGEDGSLERTVSLDFKPVASLGGSGRAIYNLAVQDLSRVGEDSDEDYNLNRKRSSAEPGEVTLTVVGDAPLASPTRPNNRTILSVDADGDNGDVSIRPLDAESLWFGSTSIQTVESAQTDVPMEESMSTDVTLTTTSLGTSPSETSSGSEGCPTSPASPEPVTTNDIIDPHQVENGRQFTTEIIDVEATNTANRTITIEMNTSPQSGDDQPQPMTDLNPSAGNFAAVRNRFEQLSGNNNALNGTEPMGSPSRTRISTPGAVVKRLSGTFEESSAVIQKTIMQMAPEVSEGALSRTVIISSLHLEQTDTTSASSPVGPESPVPKLEPPC